MGSRRASHVASSLQVGQLAARNSRAGSVVDPVPASAPGAPTQGRQRGRQAGTAAR